MPRSEFFAPVGDGRFKRPFCCRTTFLIVEERGKCVRCADGSRARSLDPQDQVSIELAMPRTAINQKDAPYAFSRIAASRPAALFMPGSKIITAPGKNNLEFKAEIAECCEYGCLIWLLRCNDRAADPERMNLALLEPLDKNLQRRFGNCAFLICLDRR